MLKIIKRIKQKLLYSIIGLATAIKEERSLWVYLFIFPIIIVIGILLNLSLIKWAIVITIIFLMFSIEIINTSLEAVVDTISFQYNVNVKKIKDIASAATLIIIIGSIISLLLIFIPEFQGVKN